MKGIKRFPFAALAVAALALGGLASTGNVAYADGEADVALVVYQTFATDAAVNDEFEYCLEAKTASAPMPVQARGQRKYCFTMKGNETYSMVLHADARTAELSEYDLRLVSSLPKGYTLSSSSVYHYKLYSHRGDGFILIAFESSGTKVEDPGFSLAYKSSPTSTKSPTHPGKTTPPSKTKPPSKTTPPSKTKPPSKTTPPGKTNPPDKTDPPSGDPDDPDNPGNPDDPDNPGDPDNPDNPGNPAKPPVSTLVRTGATISFGAMLMLLLAGGLLLSRRRAE